MVVDAPTWGAGGHPQYKPSSFLPASGSDVRQSSPGTRALLIAVLEECLRALKTDCLHVGSGVRPERVARGPRARSGRAPQPTPQGAAGEARLNLFLGHFRTPKPEHRYIRGINLIPRGSDGDDGEASGAARGGRRGLRGVPRDLAERAAGGGAAGLPRRPPSHAQVRRAILKCFHCGNPTRGWPPVCAGCRARSKHACVTSTWCGGYVQQPPPSPAGWRSVSGLPLREPAQVEAVPRQRLVGGCHVPA
jgi:hypothetical protein